MNQNHPSKLELDHTRKLVQKPTWYLEFKASFDETVEELKSDFSDEEKATEAAKTQALAIFQQLLAENVVRLGHKGEEELDNQDEDREPIDTVVIHHSSRAEGISLPALNALQLLNVYVKVYQDKENPVLNSKGEYQPIYSGHFDEQGKQVFYCYHWKVHQDGTKERLLPDSAIGWHAGNWAINKKSVAICIDDDLESKDPTPQALQAVAEIINEYYPGKTIIGHNEASDTVCPGNGFLDHWKLELLAHLR